MRLTYLTEEQCGKITTLIRQAILLPMQLKHNIPDALIFGPSEYGCMEFPKAYTLQDQLQVPDIFKHFFWDKTVDVLVTRDAIQLNAGFVTLIMEDTSLCMDYVDQGLLSSLQGRMREI